MREYNTNYFLIMLVCCAIMTRYKVVCYSQAIPPRAPLNLFLSGTRFSDSSFSKKRNDRS